MALSPYQNLIKSHTPAVAFSFNEELGSIRDYIRGLSCGGSGGRTYRIFSESGIGYSVKFNNGYFTTLSDHFWLINDAWSLEFWAKQPGMPASHPQQYLFHRNGCFSCKIDSDGNQTLVVRETQGGTAHTMITDISDLLVDNLWHHYVYNYDGSSLKLYVDGVLKQSSSFSTNFGWPLDARFTIGTGVTGNSANSLYWYGTMSEFAYYQHSLTQDQIEDHWLYGTEPSYEHASTTTGVGFSAHLGFVTVELEEDISTRFSVRIDPDKSYVTQTQPWWDKQFLYRRRLSIDAPPNGLEKDHPMYVELSKQLVRSNKVSSNLSGLKVAYLSSVTPQKWEELPCTVTSDEKKIYVKFPLAEKMSPKEYSEGRYFVYYGKRVATGSEFPYDDYDEWFFTLKPNSGELDYTHPGQDWKDGKSDTYLAKMTFRFYGDRVKLTCRRGPNQGIAEVQINDEPWVKVDLFRETPDDRIIEARNLTNEVNYLRMRCIKQKHPVSLGHQINFTKIQYAKHSTFHDIKEEADERKPWGSAMGGMINVT